MNREAVALGTPVYTTFAGRLGAVDETLDPRGPAAAADFTGVNSSSSKRATSAAGTVGAIPARLLDLLLSA